MVFDGKNGVEPQSETVWRQADKYNVPRIAFVNKLDAIGADFYMSLESIKDRLGANAVAMQLPIGMESGFSGVIDLMEMKSINYGNEDMGKEQHIAEVPADMLDKAKEFRAVMVEKISETDDALL